MSKNKFIRTIPNIVVLQYFQFIAPFDLEESCTILENFPFTSRWISADVYLSSVDVDRIRFVIRHSEWGINTWATGTLKRLENNQTSIQANVGLKPHQVSLFVFFIMTTSCMSCTLFGDDGSLYFITGVPLLMLLTYVTISKHLWILIKKLEQALTPPHPNTSANHVQN